MDWNPLNWITKANPAQPEIAREASSQVSTDAIPNYQIAFDKLEAVNRGVNMIVSAASGLDYDIKDKLQESVTSGVRVKSLQQLLNYRPNPYQSVQEFRTNIFTDLDLDGNIFIYFDGAALYHLPATNVQIQPDEKTFIKSYTYNNLIDQAMQ